MMQAVLRLRWLFAVIALASLVGCNTGAQGQYAASARSSSTAAAQTPTPGTGRRVPFTQTGSGDWRSFFHSAGSWNMSWRFDCSARGQAGQFAITVDGATGHTHQVGNAAGMQGNGTLSNRGGGGTFTLSIRSTCGWQVTTNG